MLQIAAVALMLATVVGAAFGAGTAAAAKTDVLVVGTPGKEYEPPFGEYLSTELRSLGYSVVESEAVPSDMSAYKSVWVMRPYGSIFPEEEEALENYVKKGGRLYLTGENPNFPALSKSDQRIARAVLKNQEVQVGGGESFPQKIGGEFNPNAKDGVTKSPHQLGDFLGDGVGRITGVDNLGPGHALAIKEGVPVAAVFDEADMQSGQGRLVIYMDVDYLDPSPRWSECPDLLENLENFLLNTTTRHRRPEGGEAGNVLVIAGESSTNLQAGMRTAAVLRSLHYHVTLNVTPAAGKREGPPSEGIEKGANWAMPKLKQYAAVWMLAENSPAIQGANREAIEQYVAAGGSLYLGGTGTSGISDVADEDVLRHVLGNERVTLHDGIDEGAMQFEPLALDAIAQEPNLLGEMPIHDTAQISGLASQNVLATAGDAATAAVFDEEDMRSRRGRVVLYPDDWLQTEPDAMSREAFVQNIQDFLEGTPGEIAPRSAEYAGLGDSYASGLGSFEYLPGTNVENGCYKATHGYIPRIAEDKHMTVAFEACNGAQILDMWVGKTHREPQLLSLGPDTQAITLTLGGDDLGFAGVLKTCVLPKPSLRGGPHIEGCRKPLEGSVQEALSWLEEGRAAGKYKRPGGDHSNNVNYQPSLQELYESILYEAPNAELTVIGYPYLFETTRSPSESKSCEIVPWYQPFPLTVRFGDVGWIHELTDNFDGVLKQAVTATAEATGRQIRFVDPRPAFYKHGLCDEEDSYFNSFTSESPFHKWKFEVSRLWHVQPEGLHPTATAQEVLRNLIEEESPALKP